MTQQSIRVDYIETGERHRALSQDAVERLARSMADIGLHHPISIRFVDDYQTADGDTCDGVPLLVAGAHRHAAAKLLGWEKIDCIEVEDDLVKAEMWEIAENLHRCDLTKDERDKHIRRYAELLEAARVISRQNDAKPGDAPAKVGRPQGVASEVADATGVSVRTVQRALNPPAPRTDPPKDVFDVHEQTRRRMMSAWNGATDEDRAWFRDWIDTPVMDN